MPMRAATIPAPSVPTSAAAQAQARSQAEAVLKSLLAAQAECEQHLKTQRRSDAMKDVSGSSSIERAIASTRQLIKQLDTPAAAATKPGVVVEVRGIRRAANTGGWPRQEADALAHAR